MPTAATYIFSGGASGGHLFPGLAVAEELRAQDPLSEIVFIGSERGIERDVVHAHGYRHEPLPVEPSTALRRNPVRFLWRHWRARRRAAELLDECRPAAVIGLGGFASVPVILAARPRSIPALLLEQNIVPGRATRWLSGSVSAICLAFEQTRGRLSASVPTHVTGNPVSRQIANLRNRPGGAARGELPTLLVLGGSQGATAVNELVLAAFERLQQLPASTIGLLPVRPRTIRPLSTRNDPDRHELSVFISRWNIIHQTGLAQHGDVARRYAELGIAAETAPFFSDMPARYAGATLAISRGGATSLAELAVAGVPAIIVPYPNSLGDHQRLNARYYEARGAARIVEQGDDAVREMTRAVSQVTTKAGTLRRMSEAMFALGEPQAAAAVVERLNRLTGALHVEHRRSA